MTKHVLKRMIGVVLCLCLLLQLLPQAQNVLAASSIFRCIHQVTGMMCRMRLADLWYVNMIRYNQS